MSFWTNKKRRVVGAFGILLFISLFSTLCFAEEFLELSSASKTPIKLKFNLNKTFKIVQFTDTQDDQDIDPRTVALINAVLEDQKPDLVVFTGDNITKGPLTPGDVRTAINHFVAPVDEKGIPWFITFGNHDEDHTETTGVDEPEMLDIYMSYPYNINAKSPKSINGTGNMHILVYNSRGRKPVFNVWGLDSGRYAPDKIAEQVIEDDFLLGWTWMPDWDWMRPRRVPKPNDACSAAIVPNAFNVWKGAGFRAPSGMITLRTVVLNTRAWSSLPIPKRPPPSGERT